MVSIQISIGSSFTYQTESLTNRIQCAFCDFTKHIKTQSWLIFHILYNKYPYIKDYSFIDKTHGQSDSGKEQTLLNFDILYNKILNLNYPYFKDYTLHFLN